MRRGNTDYILTFDDDQWKFNLERVWRRDVSTVEHYQNVTFVTRKENEGCYYPLQYPLDLLTFPFSVDDGVFDSCLFASSRLEFRMGNQCTPKMRS